MEHGRVAHLHVTDVLARSVFGELVGNAMKRIFVLEHAQGDVEGLEVFHQRAAVSAEVHRLLELDRVHRWERDVSLLGQLDDRREAQRAIEMHVQIGLG